MDKPTQLTQERLGSRRTRRVASPDSASKSRSSLQNADQAVLQQMHAATTCVVRSSSDSVRSGTTSPPPPVDPHTQYLKDQEELEAAMQQDLRLSSMSVNSNTSDRPEKTIENASIGISLQDTVSNDKLIFQGEMSVQESSSSVPEASHHLNNPTLSNDAPSQNDASHQSTLHNDDNTATSNLTPQTPQPPPMTPNRKQNQFHTLAFASQVVPPPTPTTESPFVQQEETIGCCHVGNPLAHALCHDSESASPRRRFQAPPESQSMVDVVSPANLPGGYSFEAEIGGQRFLATVPAGGVQQGQTFACVVRELPKDDALDIPQGYWRDGLWNFFSFGCCHPVFWHSLACPLFGLGQIQTRLELDFLGRPRQDGTNKFNRRTMATVTTAWVIMNIIVFAGFDYKWSLRMEVSTADWCALALVNVSMFAFTVFVAQQTRTSLRDRFYIREEGCYDLEDVTVSTCCLPLTLAQMYRHTVDYNEYQAVCCSKSGLPDGVSLWDSTAKGKTGDYIV